MAGQQALRAQEAQERAAAQKLQRAKDDQAHRVEALQQQAETAETKVGCTPVVFRTMTCLLGCMVVLGRGCWLYNAWPTSMHMQRQQVKTSHNSGGLHLNSDARQLCPASIAISRYLSHGQHPCWVPPCSQQGAGLIHILDEVCTLFGCARQRPCAMRAGLACWPPKWIPLTERCPAFALLLSRLRSSTARLG